MSIRVKHLAGTGDLAPAFAVRREVFIDEQQVPKDLDVDGLDLECDHFVAYDADKPVGAARVKYVDGRAKIQRVAVLKSLRGKKVGNEIMEFILKFLRVKGITDVYLESQTYAKSFYEKLGFEAEGPEFEEAGISHIKMTRKLA